MEKIVIKIPESQYFIMLHSAIFIMDFPDDNKFPQTRYDIRAINVTGPN